MGDGVGGFACGTGGEEEAGVALVESEDGLAVGSEEHEVGLPVAWSAAVGNGWRPVGEGAAVSDEGGGTTTFATAPAALGLGAGKIVAPGVVFLARELGVDEAVDGLVGDEGAVGLASQAAGDLLGRPALLEACEDTVAQLGIAIEAGAAPAAGVGLLIGIAGLVAQRGGAVAGQFSSDGRRLAIQSCSNLPDRAARGT